MTDRIVILMPVEAITQIVFVEIMVITQPANERLLQVIPFFNAEIKFCAVTRRQHHTALHHRLRKQAVKRLIELIRRKRYTFSQRYRCRFMVDTEC